MLLTVKEEREMRNSCLYFYQIRIGKVHIKIQFWLDKLTLQVISNLTEPIDFRPKIMSERALNTLVIANIPEFLLTPFGSIKRAPEKVEKNSSIINWK